MVASVTAGRIHRDRRRKQPRPQHRLGFVSLSSRVDGLVSGGSHGTTRRGRHEGLIGRQHNNDERRYTVGHPTRPADGKGNQLGALEKELATPALPLPRSSAADSHWATSFPTLGNRPLEGFQGLEDFAPERSEHWRLSPRSRHSAPQGRARWPNAPSAARRLEPNRPS